MTKEEAIKQLKTLLDVLGEASSVREALTLAIQSLEASQKLNQINFWKRLNMFVSNVKINDPMSEEEKELIINISNQIK